MIYDWGLTSQSKRWNFGFGDYGTNWNDANNPWSAVSANWDNLNNPWNAVNATTQGVSNTGSTHAQAFRNIGYASAILGGINQYKQADNYDSMAKTADINAALTRQQLLQTGKAGAKAANDTRDKGRRMQSEATAAYGASGVASNMGSALDVKSGMAYRTERDAQTQLQNANVKMWALGNEAAQYDAQAQTYRNMAAQQRQSSLLNSILQVAKIYYGMG